MVLSKYSLMFLLGNLIVIIVSGVGFFDWRTVRVGADQKAEESSVAETSRGNISIVVHPSSVFNKRLEICRNLIDLLRLEPTLEHLVVGFEITDDRYLIIKCNTDDPTPIELKLRHEYPSKFNNCHFGMTYLWEFPDNYVPQREEPGYAVDAIDTKSAADLKSDLKALSESGLGGKHPLIQRIQARIEILEESARE